MIGDHLLPLHRVAILVGEALAIDAIGQDHRAGAIIDRPVDVRTQDETVVDRDPLVPGDAHAVADFSALVGILGGAHAAFLAAVLD